MREPGRRLVSDRRRHRHYDLSITAAARTTEKIRDAGRSREAILDAAERLFSDRGYDGVSLMEIAGEAGLSRGTPSYFFGSKRQLYLAVLERAFADRQRATAGAVAPILAWCEQGGDIPALRTALRLGVDGYLRFLLERPSFRRFMTWEELAGGERLRAAHSRSTALTDAFTAVKAVATARGLRSFSVEEVVLVWVALTFGPLAHANTLMVTINRDLSDDETRRRHVDLVVDQLMNLLLERTP
jgi:AcrR family transcriptional regulator